MKGAIEFDSIEQARKEIKKWRDQMNEYWQNCVQYRISK